MRARAKTDACMHAEAARDFLYLNQAKQAKRVANHAEEQRGVFPLFFLSVLYTYIFFKKYIPSEAGERCRESRGGAAWRLPRASLLRRAEGKRSREPLLIA